MSDEQGPRSTKLELISQLAGLLLKYGPDVALAFAKMFKGGATIDDAIAALELAKTKTAEQYLAEAKAALAVQAVNP
jgi:hypothetical protein